MLPSGLGTLSAALTAKAYSWLSVSPVTVYPVELCVVACQVPQSVMDAPAL